MRRTNVYLRDDQLRVLKALGSREGAPVADLVRRAVDAFLEARGARELPEDEWRRRFDALMQRRRQVERELGPFEEEAVEDDVAEAVREVRESRAARRY